MMRTPAIDAIEPMSANVVSVTRFFGSDATTGIHPVASAAVALSLAPPNAGARLPSKPENLCAMDTDYSGLAGFGIVAIIFFFIVYAGLLVLMFWLLYTVIWRAVRRGLREFHHPNQSS